MTDAPGEGFEVGAGYVSVSPEDDDFQGQVEAIVGGTDIVVQVPVVPDAEDFRAQLEEQVSAGDTAVTVPVVPDTAGFRLLLEDELAGSGAKPVTVPVVPDAEGFAQKTEAEVAGADKPVEIPVTPDMAGFTEKADTEATAAGESAGATFSEAFASVTSRAQLFGTSGGELDAAAAASGESAGTSWRARFAAAADAVPDLEGLAAAADAEMGAAGEAAGLSFSERFAAIASRAQALAGSAATFAGIGAEDGEAAGEGFIGRLKSVVSGGMGSIEFLLGAAFVAATAVMANSFQEAMERIHTQAGVAQGAIAGLSSDVLDLAGKVGESPSGLAAALYHVESAFQSTGITGAHAMQILQIAAEGARTGGSDLVDTTNALDAIIVSGVGGFQNYAAAMGAVNAIVGAGDMTMQDFADAAGSGLFAVAKSYGQSLPEIGAALATFGDNNIRGAKAATDLRMAMQAIEAPVKTGAGALNSLGLSMTSLSNEMVHHGLTAAIGDFIEHLKASHVPISEWGQYVTEIFGKRAGVGIGVLIDQYSRLQSKLGDITGATHRFGSAWQATEATTSQKLHNLESGLEALMIRIGRGLLPYLDDIFTAVSKALPVIEKWGAAFAKVASPVVKSFFTGLRATLHLLFGPLKYVTAAVVGLQVAFYALAAAEAVVDALNPFGWAILGVAALITLTGAIIKYHKQIWATIVKTWHDITSFFAGLFDPIFHPVERVFDAIKSFITSSFDGWWKSHGAELEEVWKATWAVISGTFKAAWDTITSGVSAGWQLIGPFLTASLTALKDVFEVTWNAIAVVVKTAWDLIAAVVKIGVATVETVIKVAWDIIVGIFDIALDLLTGHWSRAWDDMKTLVTQVWNAIKSYLGSVWNAISSAAVQIWNTIKSYLTSAWHSIEQTAIGVFNDIRSGISNIWHGILDDISGVVHDIENVIGGITSLPGKALHLIGMAGGGVIPGYAPGRDSFPAMLSPGEGVLTPEAVRGLGGPGFVHAANAKFAGGRAGMAYGGVVPSFAGGGVAGALGAGSAAGRYASAYSSSLESVLTALVQLLSGQAQGARGGEGMTANFNYFGPQMPTVEQRQAVLLDLQSAISNA